MPPFVTKPVYSVVPLATVFVNGVLTTYPCACRPEVSWLDISPLDAEDAADEAVGVTVGAAVAFPTPAALGLGLAVVEDVQRALPTTTIRIIASTTAQMSFSFILVIRFI